VLGQRHAHVIGGGDPLMLDQVPGIEFDVEVVPGFAHFHAPSDE
jgi:hypothetical protein